LGIAKYSNKLIPYLQNLSGGLGEMFLK